MRVIHFIRPQLAVATIVLSLALVAAFSVAAWSFYSGHRDACQARNTTLNVLRDILVSARDQTDASPNIPIEQKQRSDRFLNESLERIDKARC